MVQSARKAAPRRRPSHPVFMQGLLSRSKHFPSASLDSGDAEICALTAEGGITTIEVQGCDLWKRNRSCLDKCPSLQCCSCLVCLYTKPAKHCCWCPRTCPCVSAIGMQLYRCRIQKSICQCGFECAAKWIWEPKSLLLDLRHCDAFVSGHRCTTAVWKRRWNARKEAGVKLPNRLGMRVEKLQL